MVTSCGVPTWGRIVPDVRCFNRSGWCKQKAELPENHSRRTELVLTLGGCRRSASCFGLTEPREPFHEGENPSMIGLVIQIIGRDQRARLMIHACVDIPGSSCLKWVRRSFRGLCCRNRSTGCNDPKVKLQKLASSL